MVGRNTVDFEVDPDNGVDSGIVLPLLEHCRPFLGFWILFSLHSDIVGYGFLIYIIFFPFLIAEHILYSWYNVCSDESPGC